MIQSCFPAYPLVQAPQLHHAGSLLSPVIAGAGWRVWVLLLIGVHALLWASVSSAAASEGDSAHPGYVGSAACAGCHQQETEHWQGSHHQLAMQLPDERSVLGDFDNAVFEQHGVETRFFRRDQQWYVHTEGQDGGLEEFPVRYVFGVYPLQQYLLPLPGGRLQALDIAWDSRPSAEGGQRWFGLQPQERIAPGDPLHWTGIYYNWNASCAECHSTDVHKGYEASTDSYRTRYAEISVGCEACHGPGEQHLRLAEAGEPGAAANSAFSHSLQQSGEWRFVSADTTATGAEGSGPSPDRSGPSPDRSGQFAAGPGVLQAGREPAERIRDITPIAQRKGTKPAANTQIDTCGRCHARRGTLGPYRHGRELLDTHRLALLAPPLYHPDGQIRDEVYVYGSFIQSRMYQAGVVCSNCHEPHSLSLRAAGNGVCAQCHAPQHYDTPRHHRHATDSSGGQCVECHMPATTYMGVDPRRDHSLRIPRPDLSLLTGSPNACTACHTEQDDQWALAALREWGMAPSNSADHPVRHLHRLRGGDLRAAAAVTEQVRDEEQPAIWRASALQALSDSGVPDFELARTLLGSESALLRSTAVGALASLPWNQQYRLLETLIEDPVSSVRLAVAEALAAVPLDQLDTAQAARLQTLFAEYEAVLSEHADLPGSRLQQGNYLARRGQPEQAIAALEASLERNPQLLAAHLNLAELWRTQGREDAAREQLERAAQALPGNGAVAHARGLLEIRSGNKEQALTLLAAAAAAETEGVRHRYVYAVALHDLGQPAQALRELKQLNRRAPGQPEVLLALINYSAETGDARNAISYARTLSELYPQNPQYRALLARLQAMQPR